MKKYVFLFIFFIVLLLSLNIALNTTLYNNNFFDVKKEIITNNKYPVIYTPKKEPVYIIPYNLADRRYERDGNKKVYHTQYYYHIYKENDNYIILQSKDEKPKKTYFTIANYNNRKTLNHILGQFIIKEKLNATKIIKNLSALGLKEIDIYNFTNAYYLPIWEIKTELQKQYEFDFSMLQTEYLLRVDQLRDKDEILQNIIDIYKKKKDINNIEQIKKLFGIDRGSFESSFALDAKGLYLIMQTTQSSHSMFLNATAGFLKAMQEKNLQYMMIYSHYLLLAKYKSDSFYFLDVRTNKELVKIVTKLSSNYDKAISNLSPTLQERYKIVNYFQLKEVNILRDKVARILK